MFDSSTLSEHEKKLNARSVSISNPKLIFFMEYILIKFYFQAMALSLCSMPKRFQQTKM